MLTSSKGQEKVGQEGTTGPSQEDRRGVKPPFLITGGVEVNSMTEHGDRGGSCLIIGPMEVKGGGVGGVAGLKKSVSKIVSRQDPSFVRVSQSVRGENGEG